MRPQSCYRDSEPINLYHKVGHGTLDMYVLSPAKDSREVKEFLQKWNSNDQKLFGTRKDPKEFSFPMPNLVSICALLVWQPANPSDTITRLLFPGSTPQHKIFEGLDKLKHLEFLKHPVCTAKSLTSSGSILGFSKTKPIKASTMLDKILPNEQKSQKIIDNKPIKEKSPPQLIENKQKENKILQQEEKKTPEMNGTAKEENKSDKVVIKSNSVDSDKSGSEAKKSDVNGKDVEIILENKSEVKTKAKIDSKPRLENKQKPTQKARSESMTRRTVEKKTKIERKVESKPSPPTPKKAVDAKVNGVPKDKDISKPKLLSKTGVKSSPSSTPAKSTKDANNRKVVESKMKPSAKKEAPSKPPAEKKEPAPKLERKPISRRPKAVSPARGGKAPASPSKKPVLRTDKNGIGRTIKLDKEGTTDSSAVSTPSADQDTKKIDVTKLSKTELEELKAKELADLKEEQEVVKEIEAVFRKDEKLNSSEQSDLRKIKDVSIDDKTTEGDEEEEEYLIVEKEEVEQNTDSVNEQESAAKEDEIQKHQRDSEESEKPRKGSDADKPSEDNVVIEEECVAKPEEAKEPTLIETETCKVLEIVPPSEKEEEEPAALAPEMVRSKEDSRDKTEEMSKEISVTSPEDKIDASSSKKLTDTREIEEEEENKEVVDQNFVLESQPDEKFSTTIESGATTAPTLPEDERIPLDEIKEDQVIEEKYVKEEIKEKELPTVVIPQKIFEPVAKINPIVGIKFDAHQSHIRDIVKTPDEVADLPVHEEVDIDTYDFPGTYKKEDAAKKAEAKKDVPEEAKKDYTKPKVEEVVQKEEAKEEKKGFFAGIKDSVKESVAFVKEEIVTAIELAKDKVHDVKEKEGEIKVEMQDNVHDIKEDTIEIEEKLVCKLSETEHEVEDKISDIKDKVEDKTRDVENILEKDMEKVKEAVQEKVDDIKEKITATEEKICKMEHDLEESAKQEIHDKVADVKEKVAEISEKFKDMKEEVTEAVADKIDDLSNICENISSGVKSMVAQVEKKVGIEQEIINVEVKDIVDVAKDQVKDAKEEVKDIVEAVQDKVESSKEVVKDTLKTMKDDIVEKIEESKQKADETEDVVKGKVEELEANVEQNVEEIAKTIDDNVTKLNDALDKEVDDTKANVQEKLMQSQEIIAESAKDVKESLEKDVKDEIKTQVESVDIVLDKIEDKVESTLDIAKAKEATVSADIEDKVEDTVTTASDKLTGKFEEVKDTITEEKSKVTELVQEAKDAVLHKEEVILEEVNKFETEIEELSQHKIDEIKGIAKEKIEKINGVEEKIVEEVCAIKNIVESKAEVVFSKINKVSTEKIDQLEEEFEKDTSAVISDAKEIISDIIKEAEGKTKEDAKHEVIDYLATNLKDEKDILPETVISDSKSEAKSEQAKYYIDEKALETAYFSKHELPPVDESKELEFGTKSPILEEEYAEREADIHRIVTSVAHVLKSDAPLEELTSSLPMEFGSPFKHYGVKGYTTELRETHITTLDSPIREEGVIPSEPKEPAICPKQTSLSFIEEEKKIALDETTKEEISVTKDSPQEKKISDLIKDSNDLIASTSKIISDIKSGSSPEQETKPEIKIDEIEETEEDKEDAEKSTTTTVHRMLVTASSEDGGEETVICPSGSITFSLADQTSPENVLSPKSTPHENLSGRSTPEIIETGADEIEEELKKLASSRSSPELKDDLEIKKEESTKTSGKSTPDVKELEKVLSGKTTPVEDEKLSGKSSPDIKTKQEEKTTSSGKATSDIQHKEEETIISGKTTPETKPVVEEEKTSGKATPDIKSEKTVSSGKFTPDLKEEKLTSGKTTPDIKDKIDSVEASPRHSIDTKISSVSEEIIAKSEVNEEVESKKSVDFKVAEQEEFVCSVSKSESQEKTDKQSPETKSSPDIKDEISDTSTNIDVETVKEISPVTTDAKTILESTSSATKIIDDNIRSEPDTRKSSTDSKITDNDNIKDDKNDYNITSVKLEDSKETLDKSTIDAVQPGKMTPEIKEEVKEEKDDMPEKFDKKEMSGKSTPVQPDDKDDKISVTSGKSTPDLRKGSVDIKDSTSGKATPDLKQDLSEVSGTSTPDLKLELENNKSDKIVPNLQTELNNLKASDKTSSDMSGKKSPLLQDDYIDIKNNLVEIEKEEKQDDKTIPFEEKFEEKLSDSRKSSVDTKERKSSSKLLEMEIEKSEDIINNIVNGKESPEMPREPKKSITSSTESLATKAEILQSLSQEKDDIIQQFAGKTSPLLDTKDSVKEVLSENASGKSTPDLKTEVKNVKSTVEVSSDASVTLVKTEISSFSSKTDEIDHDHGILNGDKSPADICPRQSIPDLKDSIVDVSGKSTPDLKTERSKSILSVGTEQSGKSTPDIHSTHDEKVLSGKSSPDMHDLPEAKLLSGKATPDVLSGKGTSDIKDTSGKATPDVLSGKVTPVVLSGKASPDLKDSLQTNGSKDISGKATPDIVSGKVTPDVLSGKSTPDFKGALADEAVKHTSEKNTPEVLSGKATPDVLSGKATPDLKDVIKDTSGKATPDILSGKATPDVLSGKATPDLKETLPEKEIKDVLEKVSSDILSDKATSDILSGKATPDLKATLEEAPEKPTTDAVSGTATPDLKDTLPEEVAKDVLGKITSDVLSEEISPDAIKEALDTGTPDVLSGKATPVVLSGKATPDLKDILPVETSNDTPGQVTSDVLSGKATPDVMSDKASSDLKDNLPEKVVTDTLEKATSDDLSTVKDLQPKEETKDAVEKASSDILSEKTTLDVLSGKTTPDLKGTQPEETGKIPSGKDTPEVLSGKATPDILSGKATPDIKNALPVNRSKDTSGKTTPDILSGKATPDLNEVSGKATPESKETISGKSTPESHKFQKVSEKAIPDSKEICIENNISEHSISDLKSSPEPPKSGKSTPDPHKSDKSTPDLKDSLDKTSSELSGKATPDRKTSSGKISPDLKDSCDIKKALDKTTPDIKIESDIVCPLKIQISADLNKQDKSSDKDVFSHQTVITTEVTDMSVAGPSHVQRDESIPSSGQISPLNKDIQHLSSEDLHLSGKSTPDIADVERMKEIHEILKHEKHIPGSSTPPTVPVSPIVKESFTLQPEESKTSEKKDSPSAKPKNIVEELKKSEADISQKEKEVLKEISSTSVSAISIDDKCDKKTEEKVEKPIAPPKETNKCKDDHCELSTKPADIRCPTPGSDDYELGGVSSPHSDISSGQMSRVAHAWGHGSSEERQAYSDDDDVPGSPRSVTSQMAHSPPEHFIEPEFEASILPKVTKMDPMNTSLYGALPDDPIEESASRDNIEADNKSQSQPIPISGATTTKHSETEKRFLDEADLDFEKAMLEHRQTRGTDLVVVASGVDSLNYRYEITTAKYTKEAKEAISSGKNEIPLKEINKNGVDSEIDIVKTAIKDSPKKSSPEMMTSSFIEGSSSSQSSQHVKKDPIESWGKPLGLPSPALPPASSDMSNKTTPKKMPPSATLAAKNKINDERKRSDSPSKYKNKKFNPVYMDLAYVPHHGNSYYSFVEFFKRIRARYYVFSGTEPSREVYNALLEAKPTWDDKELGMYTNFY